MNVLKVFNKFLLVPGKKARDGTSSESDVKVTFMLVASFVASHVTGSVAKPLGL